MQNFSFLLVIIVLFVVNSCEAPVVFTDPQPVDLKKRNAFEPQYWGSYYCQSDSSEVNIESDVFYKEKTYSALIMMEDIENSPDLIWQDGNLYSSFFDQLMEIEYQDEEKVFATLTLRDTLFNIDDNQVLKFYRGHQILSRQIDKNKWEVTILSHDVDGNISYSKTKIPGDLEQLKTITPVQILEKSERTQYLLSPSKAAFRKLMKSHLIFEECDFFERINKEEVIF